MRRSWMQCAAAIALALAGCGSSEPGDEPPADREPSAQVRAAIDDELPPRVPPLEPAIDELDATVVAVVTAEEVAFGHVRVAATPTSRQRGLMHVGDLPDGVGMLFVFDEPRTGGFWMKDTLVALQIAYLGVDGEILSIDQMTPCRAEPCPVYDPGVEYVAALEMRAGWFTDVGARVGDHAVYAPEEVTGEAR